MSRPSPYYLRWRFGTAIFSRGMYHLFFSLYPEGPLPKAVVHLTAMCGDIGPFSKVVTEVDRDVPICSHCQIHYTRYCLEGPEDDDGK